MFSVSLSYSFFIFFISAAAFLKDASPFLILSSLLAPNTDPASTSTIYSLHMSTYSPFILPFTVTKKLSLYIINMSEGWARL